MNPRLVVSREQFVDFSRAFFAGVITEHPMHWAVIDKPLPTYRQYFQECVFVSTPFVIRHCPPHFTFTASEALKTQKELNRMTSEILAAWRYTADAATAAAPFQFTVNHKHGHLTRDGRKARYLADIKTAQGAKHAFVITDAQGFEIIQRVYAHGRVSESMFWAQDNANDIFNAPPPMVEKSVYVNVMLGKFSKTLWTTDHPTQEHADQVSTQRLGSDRIACFELKVNVPAE